MRKKNVYDICKGKYKTDIAERLMCRGSLPSFSEDAAKMRGRPMCYGDCAQTKYCQTCVKQVNLFRNEEMERVSWPPEMRIKYKSYYEDPLGTGKEESDLHEHNEHPSVFMRYFHLMTIKYCYHIAKVNIIITSV